MTDKRTGKKKKKIRSVVVTEEKPALNTLNPIPRPKKSKKERSK